MGKILFLTGISIVCSACASSMNDSQRPNILLFIADDASYPYFGAYGCKWIDTPGFDTLASQGVLFENCYTPNAKSAPSRAALLTGRYSWQLEEGANHITNFPSDYKTFVEALGDSGYKVGYTGKGWAPGNPGKDPDGTERQLTGEPYQDCRTVPPTIYISDIDYTANFCRFLDETKEGEPWFFWVGAREPHRKYEYGSGISLGGKTVDMIDRVPEYWPDDEIVRTDMLDYAFELEYFDSHVVRMLQELEKRKGLENTIVIFTADNGMPFPRVKANNYELSHHQPLAVMWKGKITCPGRKVSDFVNFVDIAPTVLDAAGIKEKDSGMKRISGNSIMELLLSKVDGQVTENRNYLIFGRERDDYGRPKNQGYPIRGIIRDSLLFIMNLKPELFPACNPETGYCEIDGSPTKSLILNLWRQGIDTLYYSLSMGLRPAIELYDIKNDPDCMKNLAFDDEYSGIVTYMKDELVEILTLQGDPRIGSNGDIFDQYPYYRDENWNFYEKVVSGEIDKPWEITDWINPTDYDDYIDRLSTGEIEPMKEILQGLNW